jgi:hypothetical protein
MCPNISFLTYILSLLACSSILCDSNIKTIDYIYIYLIINGMAGSRFFQMVMKVLFKLIPQQKYR